MAGWGSDIAASASSIWPAVTSLLSGMFAIAIWDSRNKKLLLGRDRAGEKPLFYALDNKRIIFASEMKALLAGNEVDRTIDSHASARDTRYGSPASSASNRCCA